MNRALFLVLGAVAIVCVAAVTVQAAVIPMAYNNTTSTVLSDYTFETGSPTVGTATITGTGGGAIVSSDGSVTPREGSKFLKLPYLANLELAYGGSHGASDATTLSFAIQVTAGTNAPVWFGSTMGNTDVGSFHFNADGSVQYNNQGLGGWTNSGLTHNADQWNDIVATHTNGTADWTISVNGSAPVAVTMDPSPSNPTAVPVGFKTYHYPDVDGIIYLDAIPEPGTIVLLFTGLIGLLAYAWRKRR